MNSGLPGLQPIALGSNNETAFGALSSFYNNQGQSIKGFPLVALEWSKVGGIAIVGSHNFARALYLEQDRWVCARYR